MSLRHGEKHEGGDEEPSPVTQPTATIPAMHTTAPRQRVPTPDLITFDASGDDDCDGGITPTFWCGRSSDGHVKIDFLGGPNTAFDFFAQYGLGGDSALLAPGRPP